MEDKNQWNLQKIMIKEICIYLFGLDKKIQIKETFFHNANSIIKK